MKPRFKYYRQLEGIEPIAFYSMPTANGEQDVTGETLLRNALPLPLTPYFTTWIREVKAKRRCGKCWGSNLILAVMVTWRVLVYDPVSHKFIKKYTREMEFKDRPSAQKFIDLAPKDPFECYGDTMKCRAVKFNIRKIKEETK